MKVEDLSEEVKEELLSRLIDTPEAQEIIRTYQGPTFLRLVDLMHTLFCTEVHPSECNYYGESELVDCYSLTNHKEWAGRAMEFMTYIDQVSPEVAYSYLVKVIKALRELDTIQDCSAAAALRYVVNNLTMVGFRRLTVADNV